MTPPTYHELAISFFEMDNSAEAEPRQRWNEVTTTRRVRRSRISMPKLKTSSPIGDSRP